MTPKEKISRVLTDSALLMLLAAASLLIITSLLFIAGFTVTPLSAVLSLLAALDVFLFLLKDRDRREIFEAVLAAVIVVALSLVICKGIYDLSYDGNWYHKASLGSLKNGWNPIYRSLEEFAADPAGVRIGNLAESAVWADHYCKASWIIGANIYSLTGNIECAKAINPIAAFVLFAYAFSYLSSKLSAFASLAVSLLAAFNPITLAQMFTFYIDGLLMSVLFTVIVLLLGIYDEKYENSKRLTAAAMFSAIVLCVNIKFTGLAYAALFCFSFYLFGIADSIKKRTGIKPVINSTLFYTAAVAVSVLLVGSSSYVKNTIDHAHPLHPLFGSEKVDIITRNQPRFFDSLTSLEKLFYSTFSRTDNLIGDGTVQLKAPFELNDYEKLMASGAPDLRISGFGPFFSGILIISLFVIVFAAVYLLIKNRRALAMSAAVLVPAAGLLVFMSESWWARYSPHFYLFPLAALVFLVYFAGRVIKYAKLPAGLVFCLLVLCMSVNCGFFAAYIGKCAVKSADISDMLTYARVVSREAPVNIAFSSYAYYGIEFNFRDSGLNYTVVAQVPDDSVEVYSDKARMELPGKDVLQE